MLSEVPFYIFFMCPECNFNKGSVISTNNGCDIKQSGKDDYNKDSTLMCVLYVGKRTSDFFRSKLTRIYYTQILLLEFWTEMPG